MARGQLTGDVDHELRDLEQREHHVVVKREVAAETLRIAHPRA
jgi:hypothetical protein